MTSRKKPSQPPALALATLQQKLLTDAEVTLLSTQLQRLMGASMIQMVHKHGMSTDDFFRLGPLAKRLEAARVERGMNLKDVALALKTAQYKLATLENAAARDLDAALMQRYVEFLGLKTWFGRWKKANADLAGRLGL